jgi:hypothetical protein
MKLQKQLSRKYKEKEYPKYLVVISPKDIEELGWNEQDELISKIEEGTLVISKK